MHDNLFCRINWSESRKELLEAYGKKRTRREPVKLTAAPAERGLYYLYDNRVTITSVEACCKWAARTNGLEKLTKTKDPFPTP